MYKYEMGVVLRADMEEDNFRSEMDRVKGLIERFGGTIEKVDEWGRRKLAYPIAKLAEGMYTFITYTSADGVAPREVENRLNLMESVLRYLTIRLDEESVVEAKVAATSPVAAPVEVVEEPTAE